MTKRERSLRATTFFIVVLIASALLALQTAGHSWAHAHLFVGTHDGAEHVAPADPAQDPAPLSGSAAHLASLCPVCSALAGSVALCSDRTHVELDAPTQRALHVPRADHTRSLWDWAAAASRAPPSSLS